MSRVVLHFLFERKNKRRDDTHACVNSKFDRNGGFAKAQQITSFPAELFTIQEPKKSFDRQMFGRFMGKAIAAPFTFFSEPFGGVFNFPNCKPILNGVPVFRGNRENQRKLD